MSKRFALEWRWYAGRVAAGFVYLSLEPFEPLGPLPEHVLSSILGGAILYLAVGALRVTVWAFQMK